MKIFLIIAASVIVLGIGYILFTTQVHAPENTTYTDDTTTFVTNEGAVTVQYDQTGDKMKLSIDNTAYELERIMSASGAKYANEDETVVFWEHQGEASIEINGTTITAESLAGAELLTFSIAPYKKECVGVAPMHCLVVNGELFYDTIEDFIFEEGTAYELTVARIEKENVPADASAYTYRRVEVLKSNKQGDPDAHKYDFGTDGQNENCGDGTILQDGDCIPEALDDDSDGDSVPMEDAGVVHSGESIVVEQGTASATKLPQAITDKTWFWKETQYANDSVITPADSTSFAATFSEDGQFSSQTDCNTIAGSYEVEDTLITFGPLLSTKMACTGETKETAYAEMLAHVSSYMIAPDGNLILMLKFDSGSMIFTP